MTIINQVECDCCGVKVDMERVKSEVYFRDKTPDGWAEVLGLGVNPDKDICGICYSSIFSRKEENEISNKLP